MTANNPSAMPLQGGLKPILSALASARRRIRFLLALRYGARALLCSALVCIGAAIAGILHLIDRPSGGWPAAIVGAAVSGGVLIALLRPLSQLFVARLTETRADLKERLSSALEFSRESAPGSARFYDAQSADAARHAAGIDLRAAYPAKLRWEMVAGMLACAVLAFLCLAPSLPIFWSAQKKQEMAEVKAMGLQIVRVAEEKQRSGDQHKLAETRKMAMEAHKLGESMAKGKLTKKEALVAQARLDRKIEDAQRRAADQNAGDRKQASADVKRSAESMEKAMEKQAQERAARKAQNGAPGHTPKPGAETPPTLSPEMCRAKEALAKMADAIASMDSRQMSSAMRQLQQIMQSGNMSPGEMKELSKALQQLAKSLDNSSMSAEAAEMQKLAEMMQKGKQLDVSQMAKMTALMAKMAGRMEKGEFATMPEMDSKELAQLLEACKNGQLTAMLGNMPGMGGDMPGHGFGAHGHDSTPIKDTGATHPRLVAMGKAAPLKGTGKSGSAAELAKYMAKQQGPPKHLPNGKVVGSRTANGQELQTVVTGDPGAATANTPYFQVYGSGKKQAESTLDKENIPATYKQQVRRYFESIRP